LQSRSDIYRYKIKVAFLLVVFALKKKSSEKMQLKDILSKEEIEEYHKEWDLFSQKYTFETPYNVHSGVPVISKVFQFHDKPIFRAHIFKNTIRINFNPYDPRGTPYPYPYFHITHYFLPFEQIGHAEMSILREDYHNFRITERLHSKIPTQMHKELPFGKMESSIELILNIKQGKYRFLGEGIATFYDDKKNEILQIWPFEGIGELREYVKCINKLKQNKNDKNALESLIRKISTRSKIKKKRLELRQDLPDKNYLIDQLNSGNIPEQELHNYFSDWDKEPFQNPKNPNIFK